MLANECPNCGRRHEGADFTSLPRLGPVQAELDVAKESILIMAAESGVVVSRQRRRIDSLEMALKDVRDQLNPAVQPNTRVGLVIANTIINTTLEAIYEFG